MGHGCLVERHRLAHLALAHRAVLQLQRGSLRATSWSIFSFVADQEANPEPGVLQQVRLLDMDRTARAAPVGASCRRRHLHGTGGGRPPGSSWLTARRSRKRKSPSPVTFQPEALAPPAGPRALNPVAVVARRRAAPASGSKP